MKHGRRSRAEWHEDVERQQASGMGVAAYCREHGLRPANFHYHLRTWRERKRRGFVEMASVERTGLELNRDGWTIRVPPDFDAACLKRLLGVFEA